MEIKTFQISGAGNTFSLFWDNDRIIVDSKKSIIAKDICERTKTDGFIFLRWQDQKTSQKTDQESQILEWDFYNNDGSLAEMCGNASRCVAFYLKNILKSKSDNYVLNTVAGKIHLKVISESLFEVQMTALKKMNHAIYFWCDSGVPHIVIPTKDFINYKSQKELCKKLRFANDFRPQGTNVTLVEDSPNQNTLKAVTYERGVEDFTEACGTGASAAAFYNLNTYGIKMTDIKMPGGTLKMNLTDITKPIMTGPAHLLGDYTYDYSP